MPSLMMKKKKKLPSSWFTISLWFWICAYAECNKSVCVNLMRASIRYYSQVLLRPFLVSCSRFTKIYVMIITWKTYITDPGPSVRSYMHGETVAMFGFKHHHPFIFASFEIRVSNYAELPRYILVQNQRWSSSSPSPWSLDARYLRIFIIYLLFISPILWCWCLIFLLQDLNRHIYMWVWVSVFAVICLFK